MLTKSIIKPEDLPLSMTVEEVRQILRCSRPKMYQLVHTKGFPKIQISRALRIPRDAFLRWMNDAGN